MLYCSLGLPEIKNQRGLVEIMEQKSTPTIIACSPLMCGPKQCVPSDYPSTALLAGFVFVPSTLESAIPQDLIEFMQHDPMLSKSIETRSIVYFGFGSMPAPNPIELVRITIETCRLSRCRAVLVAGWSDLQSNAECVDLLSEPIHSGTIYVTKAVPHDWLFPRTSCIVHHCGVSCFHFVHVWCFYG